MVNLSSCYVQKGLGPPFIVCCCLIITGAIRLSMDCGRGHAIRRPRIESSRLALGRPGKEVDTGLEEPMSNHRLQTIKKVEQ